MKDLLIDYFKSGERASNRLIGCEFEYFLVDKNYYGLKYNDVKAILQALVSEDLQGIYEGDDLLGLVHDDYTITLEPGSQMEISIFAKESINDLKQVQKGFLDRLRPLIEQKDYRLLALGYQPKSKIEDLDLLPKERYGFMFNYFKACGPYAHNMMKGSGSTQITFDYLSEEDFVKKMRVLNVVSLILGAYFDNSPFFEGQAFDKKMLRYHIWNGCDEHRCGMKYQVFDSDFGYDKYADYVLSVPPIFYKDNYYGDKKFEQLDLNTNKETLEHIISMVFPYVRAKNYIEVRTFDALPAPYNFAVIALLKGLVYDDSNLERLAMELKDFNEDDYGKLMDNIIAGDMIEYYGESVESLTKKWTAMAKDALGNESDLLDCLDNFKSLKAITGNNLEASRIL